MAGPIPTSGRTIAVFGLVALTALAGCSGGLVSSDAETPDRSTTAQPTTAESTTDAESSTADGETPTTTEGRVTGTDGSKGSGETTAEREAGDRQQVTDRLDVVNAVGGVTDDESGIGTVNVTVRLAPGSDEVNLSQVTAHWVGRDSHVVTGPASDGGDGTFAVRTIRDGNRSAPVLDDSTDRVQLVFDPGESTVDAAASFGSELPPGSSVRIQLETQSGASTVVQLHVPESLRGSAAVAL